MKKLLVLCCFLSTLFSCQKEEMEETETYPQTWQLVQMAGQIPNSTRTGAAMSWQESYVLQADSSFTKTRQQGDQTAQASGTFSYQYIADGKYLVLTYKAPSSIIGNCTAEPKEELAVQAKNTLVSTWQACDGPSLVYKKVE